MSALLACKNYIAAALATLTAQLLALRWVGLFCRAVQPARAAISPNSVPSPPSPPPFPSLPLFLSSCCSPLSSVLLPSSAYSLPPLTISISPLLLLLFPYATHCPLLSPLSCPRLPSSPPPSETCALLALNMALFWSFPRLDTKSMGCRMAEIKRDIFHIYPLLSLSVIQTSDRKR